MFELTPIWPDFTLGRLFIWISTCSTKWLLLERLDEWFWAMFKSTSTWSNFTFGQFSVARKPIINCGAIRSKGLLFRYRYDPMLKLWTPDNPGRGHFITLALYWCIEQICIDLKLFQNNIGWFTFSVGVHTHTKEKFRQTISFRRYAKGVINIAGQDVNANRVSTMQL